LRAASWALVTFLRAVARCFCVAMASDYPFAID
jgi:hypothetical protein